MGAPPDVLPPEVADHAVHDDELDAALLHELREAVDEDDLVLAVVGPSDEDLLQDFGGV
jgi:hypothetical protein